MPIVPTSPLPKPEEQPDGKESRAKPTQQANGKPVPIWVLAMLSIVCCTLGAGIYMVGRGGSDSTNSSDHVQDEPATVTESAGVTESEEGKALAETHQSDVATPSLSLREFDQKLQAIALRWGAARDAAGRVKRSRVAYQVRLSNSAEEDSEKAEQLRVFERAIDDGITAIEDDRDEVVESYLEIVAAWASEPDVYSDQFDMTLETLKSADRHAELDVLLRFFKDDIQDLPTDEEGLRRGITEAWDKSYQWPER
jgi:hypothetical protein